jgi:hypothetical protein
MVCSVLQQLNGRPQAIKLLLQLRDVEIAAVLEAVSRINDALIADDRAAFASLLAPDLVVNNPQNGVSILRPTARRDAAGLITYSKDMRSIEYAAGSATWCCSWEMSYSCRKEVRRWPAKKCTGDSRTYGNRRGPMDSGSATSHDHGALAAHP